VLAVIGPLGIGGLAFSLAAKNVVQNVIAGALIFVNQSFCEGEEIRSLDGKVNGKVVKISWINTKIQRLDGDPVLVPNSQLVDNGIVNIQRRDFWLLEHSIPLILPTFDVLGEVVGKMQEVLEASVAQVAAGSPRERVNVHEEPVVFFEGFGHQGANIKVRAYIDGSLPRHRFFKARSDILLALNDVALGFQGAGIGFETHLVGGRSGGEAAHEEHGEGHGQEHGEEHGH